MPGTKENSDRAFGGDCGDALAEAEGGASSLTVMPTPRRPSSPSRIPFFPRYRSFGGRATGRRKESPSSNDK
ncbi:hypothetical protein V6N11_068095 [Hibiscus sabdariffa]|uniref:Uncharacterized protein n=1 Tax=Hibiscus sabdariffa TaxID=183260 RepID=A0ABR2SSN6_9ROSI